MINTFYSLRKNALIKICGVLLAYGFVMYKIKSHDNLEHVTVFLEAFSMGKMEWLCLILVVYLMFVNWGLEAFKWKVLANTITPVSTEQANEAIFSGISYGLIFSRGLGSLMTKLKGLPKDKLVQGTMTSAIGGAAQGFITLCFGLIGIVYLSGKMEPLREFQSSINFIPVFGIVLGFGAMFVAFFRRDLKRFVQMKIRVLPKWLAFLKNYKRRTIGSVLAASLVRYIVFSFQYAMVIKVFVQQLEFGTILACVAIIYLIMSVVPSLFLGGLGIRGSVSLFVLGYFTSNNLEVISASFVIWLINIALPSVIGFSWTFFRQKFGCKPFNLEHVR